MTTNIVENGSMSDFDVTEFLTMQSFESTTVGRKIGSESKPRNVFVKKIVQRCFLFKNKASHFKEKDASHTSLQSQLLLALQRGVTSINNVTVITTVTGVTV